MLNAEHKIDALLAAALAEDVELTYEQAARMARKVVEARPRHALVRPVDEHLGWIYDTWAEVIAGVCLAIESYLANPSVRLPLELRIQMRNQIDVLCESHGVSGTDYMRARYAIRQKRFVTYPERWEIVELAPLTLAAVESDS